MATDVVVQPQRQGPPPTQATNDFSIQIATVNGSGSQSANMVLLRSIFQMGIPVSGKNLFPSNIAGLPTWFTIRANKDGYIARKKEVDFLIAMNAETAVEDVKSLSPGAAVLYDEPLNLSTVRSDVVFYAAPFDKLRTDVPLLKGVLRRHKQCAFRRRQSGICWKASEYAIAEVFFVEQIAHAGVNQPTAAAQTEL